MKKKILSFLFLAISSALIAQTAEKPHAFGIGYLAHDFEAPIKKNGFVEFRDNHKTSAVEVFYTWYASRLFNLRVPISYGAVRYPQGTIENGAPKDGWISSEALCVDLQLVYKMNNGKVFPESKIVEPYAYLGFAAAGVMYDLNKKGANSSFYSPWGLGLKLHLTPAWSWNAEAGYRLNITGTPQSDFILKTGIAYHFGKPEKPAEKNLEPVKPSGDLNNLSNLSSSASKSNVDTTKNALKAPTTSLETPKNDSTVANGAKKVAIRRQAPDTAKLVAIIALNPPSAIEKETPASTEPDKDGDGTPDSRDKCPSFKGAAEDGGCPRGLFDDSDGDGIADEDDKCPKEKGSFFNFGCPQNREVMFTQQDILFKPGQAEIDPESFKVLDKLLILLNENPVHKVHIVGHTDNIGEKPVNLELSTRRAAACADYFKTKSIEAERITFEGEGETKPIDTNATETGRAKNRRVEFTFYTIRRK